MNVVASSQMRLATGSKTRAIQSTSACVDEFFEFNKPIVPHGGTISKLKLRQRKNGSYVITVFQDLNDDGRVSRKEKIYKGRSRAGLEDDYLTNFKGKIRLEKNMHRCDWLVAKYPKELIACTREYIPVTYSFLLVDIRGARINFDGMGNFASNANFLTSVVSD